ncbi:MAG: penicillin-binding transpeptidase domain-containing protein [Bdellovibrionota bacterium]
MKTLRALLTGALFLFLGLLSIGISYRARVTRASGVDFWSQYPLTKDSVARAIGNFHEFPPEMEISIDEKTKVKATIEYAFEPELQKTMEQLFRQYTPDYGAFVALDATTGRVLSMVSYSRHHEMVENLTLRSTFPSASVFKVVTAAAAMESHKIGPDTIIPYNGRNHTLYRGNILKQNVNRWTRYITVKEAFARSINTVFGKLGAYTVGPDHLRVTADRFGFNRQIAADLVVQQGHAVIPDDPWGLAESASGFTRENTMSPLQGALIAAAIANDGLMMEPYVVQGIYKEDGTKIYAAGPRVATTTVDPTTAEEIRALMRETVRKGTSRGSFRNFFKKDLAALDVGGKTGSLTGFDPRGKYDWFVGYADGGAHRIAVAALTVHEKLWRVKSSYLARRAIEMYFKDVVPKQNMALNVTGPKAH